MMLMGLHAAAVLIDGCPWIHQSTNADIWRRDIYQVCLAADSAADHKRLDLYKIIWSYIQDVRVAHPHRAHCAPLCCGIALTVAQMRVSGGASVLAWCASHILNEHPESLRYEPVMRIA